MRPLVGPGLAPMLPIRIEVIRSCDACGNPQPDPDECLCPACKAKVRK